ncbi:MAG: hypothetical protein IT384_26505 [Deltaproteobacteria bacterium]|nr:hypothetical protein [Deltaproteobacteria bacterium]
MIKIQHDPSLIKTQELGDALSRNAVQGRTPSDILKATCLDLKPGRPEGNFDPAFDATIQACMADLGYKELTTRAEVIQFAMALGDIYPPREVMASAGNQWNGGSVTKGVR